MEKEEETNSDYQDSKENSYSSNWARALSGQLDDDANEMKEIETKKATTKEKAKVKESVKKRTPKDNGMKALRKWFGDDYSDNTNTSSESDNEEWTLMERTKKNKEKMKHRQKIKDTKVVDTLKKANHIIGLGNISKKNIDHFTKEGKTFSEAKIEAVKEFLKYVLGFTEKDINEMRIAETQIAANDDLVYVAFEEVEDIKDIRRRVIDCSDTETKIRDFIPPQIYERVKYLNKICADMRTSNNLLKTQIRLGAKDVEVFFKEKGSEEPYRKVALQDIVDTKLLPKFDHQIKWTRRNERMPRRSHIVDSRPRPSSKIPHPLSRQSSTSSSSTGLVQDKKRQRTSKDNSKPKDTTEDPLVDMEVQKMEEENEDNQGEEGDFEGIEEYEDEDELL